MKRIARVKAFNGNTKKDDVTFLNSDVEWENVETTKPLAYNSERESIEPTEKIDIEEIDVTGRLRVGHNAEIGGKLTASEAVFGNDVAIHGDLYVEGTTTTTNESQVSTSGDYIVTRENNNSQMSTTDHSGLVVNNYSTGKLGAITIKSDGTWRVSADVSSTSATFTNLVSYNGSYYNGLTDTLLDPQPKLNILTDVVAGELPNCVIYDHKFYHNDGSEWKGPEKWDATNHFLQADVVTDPDLIDALDAITVQADLIYYESVTSSTISVDAEQPILTREEEGDISNNGLLKYNTTTHRAEDIAVPNVDDTALFAQIDSSGLSYIWKKVAGVVFVNALPVSPNILTNLYVYTDSNGKVSYWVGNAETQTLTEMKMDAVEWVSTLPTGNNISNKVYGIYDSTDPTKSKLYFGYRDESDTAKSKTIELDVSAVEYVTSLPTGSNIKSKVYVLGKRVYVGNYDDSTIQKIAETFFYGTQEDWDDLTATEQAEYDYVILSDNFATPGLRAIDAIEEGNLNPVTSNAVYTGTTRKADFAVAATGTTEDWTKEIAKKIVAQGAGSYTGQATKTGQYYGHYSASVSGNRVFGTIDILGTLIAFQYDSNGFWQYTSNEFSSGHCTLNTSLISSGVVLWARKGDIATVKFTNVQFSASAPLNTLLASDCPVPALDASITLASNFGNKSCHVSVHAADGKVYSDYSAWDTTQDIVYSGQATYICA